METLSMTIVLAAFVVGVFSAVLCLGQVLDAEQLRRWARGTGRRQFTIWQMMTIVVVAALLFHAFTARRGEGALSFAILSLGLLAWFARNWQKEFVLLMGLRDDEFPGRHDKLIWAAALLALAPIGVWFFRAYRLAHWPEPAPAIDREGRAEESGGAATRTA